MWRVEQESGKRGDLAKMRESCLFSCTLADALVITKEVSIHGSAEFVNLRCVCAFFFFQDDSGAGHQFFRFFSVSYNDEDGPQETIMCMWIFALCVAFVTSVGVCVRCGSSCLSNTLV